MERATSHTFFWVKSQQKGQGDRGQLSFKIQNNNLWLEWKETHVGFFSVLECDEGQRRKFMNKYWGDTYVTSIYKCTHIRVHTHTHTHNTHTKTHTTFVFVNCGDFHRRNGFYTVQTVFSIAPTPTLHLNLPLTGNFVHFTSQKTHSVWFISLLKYGDTGKCPHKSPSPCNTYVIPMSLYKFVSHTSQKHAHTHTHTHTFPL